MPVSLGLQEKHHGRGQRLYYEPEGRGLDLHVLEATAYSRLKDQGLCDCGIVPNYLGSMRKFDPSPCQSHLKMVLDDECPPSATFLEYIESLGMISLENYTQQRIDNLVDGIQQINKALVRHKDTKPRNMLVVTDTVVWIDFDRADTYHEDQITARQKDFLEEEGAVVNDFRTCMVSRA